MASSSYVAAAYVPPNISPLLPTKLEASTYLAWTNQFGHVFRCCDLMGFLDGSESCPAKFLLDDKGNITSTVDLDYLLWNKKDQFVLSVLNATLTKKLLSTVVGLNTTRQVWTFLSNCFASQSRSRITNLKRLLQTLHQGSKSCTEFLDLDKEWAAQLAAVGKLVEGDDLIGHVVSGLNASFNPFIASLSVAS